MKFKKIYNQAEHQLTKTSIRYKFVKKFAALNCEIMTQNFIIKLASKNYEISVQRT